MAGFMESLFVFAQFIFAVAILILVHELGHFLAAKLTGIQVKELGIGFPPRIAHLFTRGGTDFTLNWIPLGGFVRPAGENDAEVAGGFSAASPWARLVMLAAGPAMNFLAALILFSIIFIQLGRPDLSTVVILDVSALSPAAEAGLQSGDIVLEINSQEIGSSQELHDMIYANLGESIELLYSRNGQISTVGLVPRDPPPEEGAIGIAMGNPSIPIGSGEALFYGGQAIGTQVAALIALPSRLFSGELSAEQGRLVGYKGMYDIYTEVRQADAEPATDLPSGTNTLAFFASISVSLALLNLMPIPALDGGRILFTLPEIIFGRRIPPAYENMINAVGLALLFLLVIYVNIQDFVNPVLTP